MTTALGSLLEGKVPPFETQKLSDTQLAKPFRVTPKEIARASEDGIVIVARPQPGGTKGLFAVDVSDPEAPRVRGVNWYEVPRDGDVTQAVTMLNRDLDKFFGLGGEMSSKGRHRAQSKKIARKDESALPAQARRGAEVPNAAFFRWKKLEAHLKKTGDADGLVLLNGLGDILGFL